MARARDIRRSAAFLRGRSMTRTFVVRALALVLLFLVPRPSSLDFLSPDSLNDFLSASLASHPNLAYSRLLSLTLTDMGGMVDFV